MDARYDPDYMQSFYDAYGEREWERFEVDPAAQVNFHVHRWYLRQFIRQGDRVLDMGAGPGRFTIELARLGARVTVCDLSPVQLELNRQRVATAGCEDAVEERAVMDILDLSRFAPARFDAVVCYGGPLSYVFAEADRAIDELARVTRPGGHILLSVMSLLGTSRRFLPAVLDLARRYGIDRAMRDVMATGDLKGDINNGHPMHLYRSEELIALLERHGCRVAAVSAANFLSPGHEAALTEVVEERELWNAVLEAEVESCRQPGALDGGTHIIAVAQCP